MTGPHRPDVLAEKAAMTERLAGWPSLDVRVAGKAWSCPWCSVLIVRGELCLQFGGQPDRWHEECAATLLPRPAGDVVDLDALTGEAS